MHPKKLSSKSMDMTTGSTWKLLLSFAVPLLIGNLFQQLYNTVDSLVVGNFVGTEALAAVGSTTSIINTMVMFFNGTSIGASVIISRHYGAHDDKKLHLAVETTIMVTFLASILFTALGIFLAPFMLRFMSTPDDVLESASVYLRIYFSGIAGLLVYNMGSAVLRAVGDTKRPLLFLCFSSILNTVLDLVFVIVFHLGIAGVAYATIISQFLSAALVLAVLTMDDGGYRLVWKDLSVDKKTLKQILSIGLPAGLQQSLTSFSNVYVQSYINYFGSACMAGWSCYTKIDQFIFLPLQSMNQAATTFVSQNIGARNIPRAKRGSLTAFYMSTAITLGALAYGRTVRGHVQPGSRGDPLWDPVHPYQQYPDLHLLCHTDLFRISAGSRGFQDSHVHHALFLCAVPAGLSVRYHTVHQHSGRGGLRLSPGLDDVLSPHRPLLFLWRLGKTDPLIQLPRSTWSRIWARGSMAFLASSYVFVWAPTSMRAERARTCWLYRSPLR